MNALITFRANAAGNLLASRAERRAAALAVTSNLQSKAAGIARRLASESSAAAKSSATTASTATKAASSTGAKESSVNTLDRDAFLQLLVTQMQYQDPLEPVDNSEMIAQLAQFSALEQMTSLNESFEDLSERMEYLVGNVDQLNFISAQGLLGRYVKGINLSGKIVEGWVDSVTLEGSIVVLSIDDDYVPMTGVIGVWSEAPETTAAGEEGGTTEEEPL